MSIRERLRSLLVPNWYRALPPKSRILYFTASGLLGACFGALMGAFYGDASPVERAVLIGVMVMAVAANILTTTIVSRELEKKYELDQEHATAREIQARLQPQELPRIPGVALAARYRAFRLVGGDFYDCELLDPDHLWIAIADVSGKGVSAAFLMANLQGIVRSLAGPHEALDHVAAAANVHFERHTEPHRFVTAFLARLHLPTRRLEYVNAGHNHPLVSSPGKEPSWLDVGGPPLGLAADATYTVGSTVLPRGATLLLYTDGIVERMNPRRDLYGEERLARLVESAPGLDLDSLLERILIENDGFAEGSAVLDDRALLALRLA